MILACFLLAAVPLAAADVAPDGVDGNLLVEDAVKSLLQQSSLEAKIRQRATVFGQLASGSGLYVQSRDSELLRIRFEFKLQVADKSLTLLHVNDGSTLWIRRDDGTTQSQAYINLRRIREAASSKADGTALGSGPAPSLDLGQVAAGGLAQLLGSLGNHFDFGTATPSEVSGIPMWEISGEWKKDQLAKLLPSQAAQIRSGRPAELSQLPTHLPTIVKLTLGRDRQFPLFPYRIEYGRLYVSTNLPDQGKRSPAAVRPLVTMELYEVQRPTDLQPELFAYPIGDENVEDRTDAYLQQLGLTDSAGSASSPNE